MSGATAQRAALGLAAVAAASIGFERLDPSLGVTADLRLTNLRLVVALALVVWLVGWAMLRRWPRVPMAIGVPAGLWLAMFAVSATFAPAYQTQALAFVRDLAFGMAFGWLVYAVASTPSRQVLIARALAISGMGVAIFGVAEAANIGPVVQWLQGFRYQASFDVGELPRISSTLPHPNVAAMLLGLALPLQIAWLATSRALWTRVTLGLGTALELATLVLTVSRAGMLASAVVLALMVVAGVWLHQSMLAWTSLVAGVGLAALFGISLIREPAALLHLTSESIQAWYRADYSPPAELAARPGEVAVVPVRLTNMGDRTWTSSGVHPFALSYHLENVDGGSVTYDGPRTPLPLDLTPGDSVELEARLVAPSAPGTYIVDWDGVQEAVTWFSWAGTPLGRTRLMVTGQPAVAQSDIVKTTPPTIPPPPPSRLTQWRIAIRMARNRPLLGVGPDNFRWVYGDFAGLTTWDTGGHANSVYFEWLADTGLVGLALYVWLAWRLLRTSFSGLLARAAATPLVVWRVGFAASLLAWFLHGLLDYFYEPLPTNLAFWLVAGLALAGHTAWRNARNLAPCALSTT
jgi:O-antigen ligase/polysaccharide polymerase Wzy-like membrane protein